MVTTALYFIQYESNKELLLSEVVLNIIVVDDLFIENVSTSLWRLNHLDNL